DVRHAACAGPEGPRRLPHHAAGLKLPADFPRTIEAVACDLDRALIGEDTGLRPRTREAVAATRAAGIPFVLVTGPMFRSVRPYALEAGGRAPALPRPSARAAPPRG